MPGAAVEGAWPAQVFFFLFLLIYIQVYEGWGTVVCYIRRGGEVSRRGQ